MIRRARSFAVVLAGFCAAWAVGAQGASAAAPAWLPVAASGPTVIPRIQSEVQQLWVDAEGGSYTLTVGTGAGKVSTSIFSNVVTLTETDYGSFHVGDVVSMPDEQFLSAGATITDVSGSTLTLSGFIFTAGDDRPLIVTESTAPIAHDAPATGAGSLGAALAALPGVGSGTIVGGGPGGPGGRNPYTIAFGGALANADLPRAQPDAEGLVGGGETATIATKVQGGPGSTRLALYAQNIGGYESHGDLTMRVQLPPGIVTAKAPESAIADGFAAWTCSSGTGQSAFTCTYHNVHGETTVAPSLFAQPVWADVVADPTSQGGDVTFEVSGGGAKPATGTLHLKVDSQPAPPGVQTFAAGAYDINGTKDARAGAHPYSAGTVIFANTRRSVLGKIMPSGEFKDIEVDLPPGFLGNPTAVPACPEAIVEIHCPFPTMVGVSAPLIEFGGALHGAEAGESAVFNTEAPFGTPAKFRFNVLQQVPLSVVGQLRSDTDFGITAGSLNTPQLKPVYGAFFTFWGAPADKSHDSARCNRLILDTVCGPGADGPPTALLTNPVNCAEQAQVQPVTDVRTTFWQFPEARGRNSADIPPVTGCGKLKFEANFGFVPAETSADSPTSFKTSLEVPSEGLTNPRKLVTPPIRESVIRLPEGVVLNAAAADGLQSCSLEQIGFKGGSFPMPNPMHFSTEPNSCPEASKIGTGELTTALLDEPLQGTLYLAAQGEGNPFGSLFALYLVIEDPRHGIFLKLPGRVDPDPRTGQLVVTFKNLPQLPFTKLDLSLKGGPRAALANPTTCGRFVSTIVNTPWSAPESGPPTESRDVFEVNRGPGGQGCAGSPAQRLFDVGWQAGSESRVAGAKGTFKMRITRPDGSQELDSLELSMPKGLTASLRGIPYCGEAQIAAIERRTGRDEQQDPTCPAASQVGTVLTGAGSGPAPFYVPGKLYLAGPYEGAPISIVTVTPAVAGPFDLGNVVVRSAVYVNSRTAELSAKTDRIPQILKGVVLRVRDVRISLDRKDWTINPTNCEPAKVKLLAHGNSGASADRAVPFQVDGCKGLRFTPKLTLRVLGKTNRNAKPRFRAVLTPRPGEANIARAQVNLPHSEFLEQNHIKTICTRVQWNAGAGHGSQCPKGSIYGYAKAWTPLLDAPLQGPVYLRSSSHKLPDLVAALNGQVDIELVGKVDSGPNEGIRNTFEVVPDAPVSRFVLTMRGGKKGLLVNSENLCEAPKAKRRAIVRFTGQNGKVRHFKPLVRNDCGKRRKHRRRHSSHRDARQHRSARHLSALLSFVKKVF